MPGRARLSSCIRFSAEPFTMIRDIRSLPAGHCLVWEHGISSVRRYWSLPSSDTVSETVPQDLYMEMSQRLKDAVGSQLVSDVPLGVFLSGGIDSTAIAALASQAASTPIRTFSVVFREKANMMKRLWSNLVVKHVGSEHTEIELTGDQLLQWLPRIVNAFDEPSADGINTFFVVSKLACETGMTVALSGLGGDEVFGGYNGFRKALLIDRLFAASTPITSLLVMEFHLVLTLWITMKVCASSRPFETKSDPHLVSRRLFSKSQIHGLLNREIPFATSWEEEAFGSMTAQAKGYDTVNRISAFELQTYMRSTLLRIRIR